MAASAADKVNEGISAATARGIGGLTEEALAGALTGQLQRLNSSELLVLISGRPEIERGVLKQLLGNRTVADLVAEAPGPESVRLATAAREQLSTARPLASARAGSIGSNVAWGVSDFVVDRVERQLRTYALRGLARQVCVDVGAAVLRESCQVLESAQFGVSSAGAGMLRSAVRRDLERLPSTAVAWTYAEFGERMDPPARDRAQVVMRGVGFALHVSRGSDPWLALASVADSLVPGRRAAIDADFQQVRAQLARLNSQLREPALADSVRRRLRGEATALQRRIATDLSGAAPQYLDPVAFPLSSVLSDLSALYATRFDLLRLRPAVWGQDVARTLLRAQLIAMLANARAHAGPAIDPSRYQPWRFASIAIALDEEFGQIQRLRAQVDTLVQQGSDTLRLRNARITLAQAAFDSLERLLAEVQQSDLTDVSAAQRALAASYDVVMPLVEGDYGAAVLGLRDQVALLAPNLLDPGRDARWIRGLTFVSELSGAGSADQVNAALVRLTEGGQGFEAKRDAQGWRVGLNAYGGIYGGADWKGVTRERAGGESSAFGGLYLPVGLAVTPPIMINPFRIGRAGTLGLFVQVADLGALASWRFDRGEKVDERPEVDLGQVFSPGAFLVLNIRALPLSVGYGWSYAPQLRRARDLAGDGEGDAAVPERFGADRRGIFIAVDVPLFP